MSQRIHAPLHGGAGLHAGTGHAVAVANKKVVQEKVAHPKPPLPVSTNPTDVSIIYGSLLISYHHWVSLSTAGTSSECGRYD